MYIYIYICISDIHMYWPAPVHANQSRWARAGFGFQVPCVVALHIWSFKIYICTHMHICMYACIHVYIHTHIHTYIHAYIYPYIHIHIYLYTHMHMCIYTYTH